ncbi:MAG: HEAT repeat domain-containing protein [Verrucomicrobia bacterium]|nr:HEAT repeat domain-containing protein [Verrucomicrobiota bacterium]
MKIVPVFCPAALALAIFGSVLQGAPDEDVFGRLRQFRYGQDAAVLTQVEKRVAAVTANPTDLQARQDLAGNLAAILQTDASYEAKQFVCRQLAVVGTARQVPLLARLLTDSQFSDMARYALGAIPDRSVNRALRQALNQTSGKTQIGIINTLGFRRDTAAVRRLGRLLNGADPGVATAAAHALGNIGGPEAAGLLSRTLARATGEFHFAVADAYLACAEGYLARNDRAHALEIGRELFQARQPVQTRVGALRLLAGAGGNEGVGRVLESLRDPDPVIHRAALGCVRLLAGPEAIGRVAADLSRLPAADQVVVLGALADLGNPAALPAAESAARSGELEVRRAALLALGQLGNAATVPTLVRAGGESGDVAERDAALAALRSVRGSAVDAAVIQEMQRARGELRAELIAVLADRSATAAVPALLAEARGEAPQARQAAFRALAQLGSASDMPALVRLLVEARDDSSRADAEQAVLDLAVRTEDRDRRADAILAALPGVTSVPARCSLLRVLGGVGDAKALQALVAATRDPESAVQNTAVRELSDWQDTAALDSLAQIFQTTTNPTHRILALRGYLRLVGSAEDLPTAEKLKRCRAAMDQIRSTDEKKLVLAGLGSIADPVALRLVLPYLDDPAVRTEAAEATLQIARTIYASDRAEVKQALQRVLTVTTEPQRRQQAEVVLRDIDVIGDYITDWQVAGPYFEPGKNFEALFDMPFPPENPTATNVDWREIRAGTDPSRPWVVDLLKALGGDERVAYLRARIYSDRDRDARLDVGSDDGVKIWVNGKVVHANNVARALTRDSDHVTVGLRQGWNTLLLKVTQNNQGWECCVRLHEPDGGRIPGVRIAAAGEE